MFKGKYPYRETTDGTRKPRDVRLGDLYTSADRQQHSELTVVEQEMMKINGSQQCGGGRRVLRKKIGGD